MGLDRTEGITWTGDLVFTRNETGTHKLQRHENMIKI